MFGDLAQGILELSLKSVQPSSRAALRKAAACSRSLSSFLFGFLVMTVDEWIYFVASGKPPVVTVATLPSDLCRFIGASTPLVRLRHDYALKLHQWHSFRLDELPLLPIAIDLGRVISDQPRRLTFFYFERVISNRWYQATIKSTSTGQEMWVMSFYLQKPAEVERMCRRCPILRKDEILEAEEKAGDF